MNEPVSLELAIRLKAEGFSLPTVHFYQNKVLPFNPKGLKSSKNGEKLDHNKYDDFIYSAPLEKDGINWLIGKKMYYESTLIFKFGKNGIEK